MNHYLNSDVAIKYGMVGAILIDEIVKSIKKNDKDNVYFYNNNHWYYGSAISLQKKHQYLTRSLIQRTLKNLVNTGALEAKNINKLKSDRTFSYRVIDKLIMDMYDNVKYIRKVHTKYQKFLQTLYWQDVKLKVLDRGNDTCQYCGATASLQVHHLTYEHHGNEMEYLDDLVVLCRDCHKKEHNID